MELILLLSWTLLELLKALAVISPGVATEVDCWAMFSSLEFSLDSKADKPSTSLLFLLDVER